MLNIIQNTIGAIRRVGESVVRAGLKMWLPFTKAEPLGENLVVNGDFATDSDWTEGVGWDIENEKGVATSVPSGQSLSQSSSIISGVSYKVTYTVLDFSEGGVYVRVGNLGIGTTRTANGTYTETIEAAGNSTIYFTGYSGSTTLKIDNVSVEEYAQETPDISGNDNNAILKTGKALQFTGNDSVQTSFPSSYTIKTIAFWINPTHSSTNEVVFYGGGAMGGTRELRLDHLQLEAINGNINMNTYVNGTLEGVTYGGTPATLTQDEWQRVVLTSSTGFTVVSDTFDIASGLYGSDGRFIMSDLQIYDEAWTTDDIAYDYANPQKLVTDSEDTSITLDNLKAWWHMSEGDGTIAFDSAPLIGKELVVNGDFATDSDWTESTQSDISGGKARILSTDGSYQYIQQSNSGFTNTQGKFVKITLDIVEYVSGTIKAQFAGGSNYIFPQSIGTHTLYVQNDGSSGTFNIARVSGVTDITIDNVSLKEVYNIDGETYDGSTLGASYVDAQERIPQLGMMNWSKGSNLFKYSEDLSQNYWSKTNATITLNDAIAPDGTISANKLNFAASSFPQIFTTAVTNLVVGEVYTASFYVKSDGTTQIEQSTQISGVTPPTTFTPTSNWQRVEITFTATNTQHTFVIFTNTSNAPNSSFYIWGLQMEKNSFASTYRRTNVTYVTDATLIASATDSQKDILGNAVRVKGSGFNLDGTGYGEVLDDASINPTTAITIGCWVYFEGNKNDLGIVGKWETSKTDYLITQIFDGSNRKLRFYIDTTDGRAILSSPAIVGDKWVYVACTYNKDAGTNNTKIYTIIPGNLDGSGNQIIEKAIGTHTGSINDSDNNITIGQYNYTGSTFFDNKIDDVKIYNTDLSEAQIEQNYNATKSGHNN